MNGQRERIVELLRKNRIVASHAVLDAMGTDPDGIRIAREAVRKKMDHLSVEFYLRHTTVLEMVRLKKRIEREGKQ